MFQNLHLSLYQNTDDIQIVCWFWRSTSYEKTKRYQILKNRADLNCESANESWFHFPNWFKSYGSQRSHVYKNVATNKMQSV